MEDMTENMSIIPRRPPSSQTSQETFCRQKLALLQCEYDPKSCNKCSRRGTEVSLKSCTKCKTAVYCSKQCQVEDWKPRHKKHCKEIQRLRDVVQGKSHICELQPARKPWLLDPSQTNPLYLSLLQDKQVVLLDSSQTIVQYTSTGNVIGRQKVDFCGDYFCVFQVGNLSFVALSRPVGDEQRGIDVWPLSTSANVSGPIYEYRRDSCMFSTFCVFSSSMFAFNVTKMQVEEFDISSYKINPTGFKIPVIEWTIMDMSICEKDGQRRLVYLSDSRAANFDVSSEAYRLTCVDFEGRFLWRIGGEGDFYPRAFCSDGKGRIFASDKFCRIFMVDDYLRIHTLFKYEGEIKAIRWCDVTNQLHVIHATDASNTAFCSAAFHVVENQLVKP